MRKALLFGVLLLFGFIAMQIGFGMLMWGEPSLACMFAVIAVGLFAMAGWQLSEELPARRPEGGAR